MFAGGRRRNGGPGGHGRSQGGNFDRRKRSVFTKLLKDENAVMQDMHQAKRFLEGMETFPSKAELLAKLQDEREEGKRRVSELLSFINSVLDVETLLIPLLDQILNDETGRPMFRPLRDNMLLEVFHTPMLLQTLDERDVAGELQPSDAKKFCSFLRALTKPFIEPRQSRFVQSLATALRERGDVDEARILCSSLLLDETHDRSVEENRQNKQEHKPRRKEVACWVTDMEPPGGRHDNDHRNYRDIRIVPTVQELTSDQQPYLPLANGENSFIDDPVAALLDRNFRLLRDDAVSSMKLNLAETEAKCWKNARITDINISTSRPKFSVSFVIQCDLSGRAVNWKRSRALMHGSVVALCREGRPFRMGTIVLREDSVEWLNDPSGPKIGVRFESHEDFQDSIIEMAKNCTWNERYCDLNSKYMQLGRHDPQQSVLSQQIEACEAQMETYDLIEVSKSFFAYQPILKTLQDMDSLPMEEELIGREGSSNQPDYLPDKITLPKKDFGGYEVDMNNWSLNEIVKRTSLDRSQAKALHHSLTSRVVLTQGPPGTGKTFLGALVARVIRENTNESILCVCYTNHALDQFLEHMLDAGETRMVRMGGRSKSERLSKYQLKELARTKSNTESFCQKRIKQVHAHLFKAKEQIDEIIKVLKTPLGWKEPSGGLRSFLGMEEPLTLHFLEVPDLLSTDGFNLVGPRGKRLGKDMLWKNWKTAKHFQTGCYLT